jgi:prophage tail gpP-like protein
VGRIRIEAESVTDPTETPFVVEDWISYDLTSDMMSGADTFTIDLVPHKKNLDAFRIPGQKLRVYYDDNLIFTGIVDATPTSANSDGVTLQLTGRDFGGLLVDTAAPLLDFRNKDLLQITERLIEPVSAWINVIDIDYSFARKNFSGRRPTVKKRIEVRSGIKVTVSTTTGGGASKSTLRSIQTGKIFKKEVKPGETIGSILDELCDHVGCRWWVGPNGTLYISQPEYQQEPVARLYVKIDDHGNITDSNCSMNRSSDIGDRAATYSIVGQGRGGATQNGVDVADKFGQAIDPSKSFWYDLDSVRLNKTATRSVRSISNRKLTKRLARTIAEEKIIRSYSMTATCEGHWTSAVNPRDDGDKGTLWGVDMVVDIDYQPKRVAGPHTIIMRNFRGDKEGGRETNLTPIPTDIWLATEHDAVTTSQWAAKLRNTMDYYAL